MATWKFKNPEFEDEHNQDFEDDLEGTFNDWDTRLSPNTHHAKWNMPQLHGSSIEGPAEMTWGEYYIPKPVVNEHGVPIKQDK